MGVSLPAKVRFFLGGGVYTPMKLLCLLAGQTALVDEVARRNEKVTPTKLRSFLTLTLRCVALAFSLLERRCSHSLVFCSNTHAKLEKTFGIAKVFKPARLTS